MTYSFERLREFNSVPPTSLPERIVREGQRAICSLYENHPTWVVNQNSPTAPFGRAIMNSLCAGFPPPPPLVPPPFEGGQCPGTVYKLRYYTLQPINGSGSNGLEIPPNPVLFTLSGTFPNGVSTYTFKHDGQFKTVAQYMTESVSFSDPLEYFFFDIEGVQSRTLSLTLDWGFVPVRFEPADGSADLCGNPPPQWEPEPPPTIIDLTSTTTITLENNETLDLDITIQPSEDGRARFPNVVNINNTDISIDIRGAIITNNYSGGGNSGGDGDTEFRNPEPEVTSDDTVEIPVPVIPPPPEEDGIAKLVGLKVELINRPSNADIVSGRGAPDIYYFGWVEFKLGDYLFPRTFLNFEKNVLVAPEGADGYAITFKEGYTGSVTKIIQDS